MDLGFRDAKEIPNTLLGSIVIWEQSRASFIRNLRLKETTGGEFWVYGASIRLL